MVEAPRCPNCFAELPSGACPDSACAADAGERSLNDLPVGALLAGQFRIGRVLGRGGFGITYLAWDEWLQRRAAVKECFPLGLVQRGSDRVTVRPLSDSMAPQFVQVRALFL